jgi:hypothetical protein
VWVGPINQCVCARARNGLEIWREMGRAYEVYWAAAATVVTDPLLFRVLSNLRPTLILI